MSVNAFQQITILIGNFFDSFFNNILSIQIYNVSLLTIFTFVVMLGLFGGFIWKINK